jgi:oligoribonuclease NrnB/cAMP/cGMP phosphodiesterase (DHH superfamily)
MITRTIVFYHGSCPDGFGGAYAAWKKFGDAAEYVPLTRGDDVLPDVTGADVFFIDFVYEKERMDEIAAKAKSFIALDHHAGVQAVTESFPGSIFDNDRSGATLAWHYFHPDELTPRLLSLVEDDDLFRFLLPDTRPVISYLSVKPYTFELWDEVREMLDHPEKSEAFLAKVHTYAEYFELLAQLAVDHAKLVEFEGHQVYFATAHPFKPMKSLVGNLLAKKQGPFALVVAAHPKGFGVSIRGDGSIDVSAIAQKYGGNGHKSSSGFLIPAGGPMPWTIVEDADETPRD